jgi:hypothetical protein
MQIEKPRKRLKEMIAKLSESMTQQVCAAKGLSGARDIVSEMGQSISAVIEEQTVNAKQMSKAVESVDELAPSAASATKEMSSANERLSSISQAPQRRMAQFKGKEKGRQVHSPVVDNGNRTANGQGNGNGASKKTRGRLLEGLQTSTRDASSQFYDFSWRGHIGFVHESPGQDATNFAFLAQGKTAT